MAALALNLAPLPVPEVMFGMAQARLLMAGVELGVFSALSGVNLRAEVLATQLKLHPDGLLHVLECLTAMGYLRHQGPTYTLRARARKWLDPASPTYVGTFLRFNYAQWNWWSSLEEVVRTGHHHAIHESAPQDERWALYIRAMFELARLSADEVAAAVKVPDGATRLLDVAGGHGWFASRICLRNPGLRGTVFDLPGSARAGRLILEEMGGAARVEHREGDLFTDDLGGPYDVILFFQTLRHFTPAQNEGTFRRFYEHLRPGGTLAVLDYLSPEVGEAPDGGSVVGLHYWLTTGGARYPASALREVLNRVGFTVKRERKILRLPYQKLFICSR